MSPAALEDARRERIRAASKAWRAANPERVRANNAARNWKRKLKEES